MTVVLFVIHDVALTVVCEAADDCLIDVHVKLVFQFFSKVPAMGGTVSAELK